MVQVVSMAPVLESTDSDEGSVFHFSFCQLDLQIQKAVCKQLRIRVGTLFLLTWPPVRSHSVSSFPQPLKRFEKPW